MNETLLQQQIQIAQFNAHVTAAHLQLAVQRFWADEIAKPRNADPKRLLRYGFKVYSQNDEDGILQEIFKRVGTANKTFIEFGVESGSECNTAKLLLEGWRGLWIEAAPQHANTIRRSLGTFTSDKRLTLVESMVTAENVNNLFSQAGFTGEIDLLSIDIDFNDYWIWKAIEAVKPRVVAIEYNSIFRPPMSLVVPYEPTQKWDGSNYGGASLEALVRLGRTKGYRIVGCSFAGVNAFFVRDDLCADHFVEPATAEEHYEPTRFFHAAQGGHPPRLGPYVTV
jgi:hypothetical protein